MKKTAWGSFLFILTAGLVSGAPSLKLDNPNGGETLAIGSNCAISWTASGVTQNIRLILLQNGSQVGVIADSLAPGSSPYPWNVGRSSSGTAAPGGGYAIRIRTLDGSLRDASDGTFTISSQGAAPTLKITFPVGGETLPWGGLQPFQWSALSIAGNVKVTLLRNGSPAYVISPSVSAAAGAVGWTVGNAPGWSCENQCGGGYKLRVEALTVPASAESPATFTITASSSGDKPDFQVSHMVCSPRVKNGAVQTVVVQLYVKNNGAEYNGPLSIHYICLDSLVHTKIALDEVITLPSITIPHGQWYGFDLCQPAWPAGVKTINFGIQVDPANLVQETNETNNHFDYSYTLPPLDEIVVL
jgi:hypothetical protein